MRIRSHARRPPFAPGELGDENREKEESFMLEDEGSVGEYGVSGEALA
jgi:hypothetical protein